MTGRESELSFRTAPILKLPVEIVNMIVQCSGLDACTLRLLCKELEYKSRSIFIEKYFQDIRVMTFSHSLRTLVEISRNPRVARAIRQLTITTDTLAPHHAQDHTISRFLAYRRQHIRLGRLRPVDILCELVPRLPNCTSVEVSDSHYSIDVDGRFGGRFVTVPRALGTKAVIRELEIAPGTIAAEVFDQDNADVLNYIFTSIISALSRCENKTSSFVTRLESNFVGIPLSILQVPSKGSSNPWRFPLLKTLDLRLEQHRIPYTSQGRLRHMHNLGQFLTHFPKLENLRVYFDCGCLFYEPLYENVARRRLLPRLRHLRLVDVCIREVTLIKLLNRFADSLEHLSLDMVGLVDVKWTTVLSFIQVNLSHLQIGHLNDLTENERPVRFWNNSTPEHPESGFFRAPAQRSSATLAL